MTNPVSIASMVDDARRMRDASFHVTPPAQLDDIEAAVSKMDELDAACDLAPLLQTQMRLARFGMELIHHEQEGEHFAILRERIRLGRGIYIRRCTPSANVVVQVPHSYADVGTRQIGLAIFHGAKTRWLFVNTWHRYKSYDGESPSRHTHLADVAHAPTSIFQSATAALAWCEKTIPSTRPCLASKKRRRILQLHGHRDRPGLPPVIISSAAQSTIGAGLAFADAVRAAGVQVGVYGENVHVLGGTTNQQARVVDSAHFVHVELSRTFRDDNKVAPLIAAVVKLSR